MHELREGLFVSMHVFLLHQPCLKPGQSSCGASASKIGPFGYKGFLRRFHTRFLYFVSILVLLGVVGKRKLILHCILLSCAVPLFRYLRTFGP